MRVLLTGANGFIGRSLIPLLKQGDTEVITVGRGLARASTRHLKLDLLEAHNLSDVFKEIQPTRLIHLAWYTEHGKYWDSDLNLKWITATWRILDAFYASGGEHALVAGTCAEYDCRQGYCSEDITPSIPSTVYGIAKDTSRRISEILSIKYGVPLGWARIFFAYGAGEPSSRLIPSLFAVFSGRVDPFGVGISAFRDLLHVSDVARALAICSQSKISGIINVSSGNPTQIDEVVKTVAKLCQREPELIPTKETFSPGEPEFLVGRNKKLTSLGWKQTVKLEQGLIDYLSDNK